MPAIFKKRTVPDIRPPLAFWYFDLFLLRINTGNAEFRVSYRGTYQN